MMYNPKLLYLKNFIWVTLLPGSIAILIPHLLFGSSFSQHLPPPLIFTGIVLCIIGLTVLLWCVYDFITKGHGTLSPIDPAKRLVVQGLYLYSRNPMYVGVMMILIGQSLTFGSWYRLVYSFVVLFAFNLFIRLYEEPYLERTFGKEYEIYCHKVRRWI